MNWPLMRRQLLINPLKNALLCVVIATSAWYWRAWSWLSVFVLLSAAYVLPYLVVAAHGCLRKPMEAIERYLAALTLASLIGALLAVQIYQHALLQHPALLTWDFNTAFMVAFAYCMALTAWPAWQHYQQRAHERMQQLKAQQKRAERALIETELRMMQAQVEPHFLFNTLAQLLYMLRENSPQAGDMLQHLIAYLRAALPDFRQSASSVERELQLARHYLTLMQFRMGQRLQFSIDCAPHLLSQTMPPLMLLSLVENAIKHGIEPKPGPGLFAIAIQREQDQLHISVSDNGRGVSETFGGGVGLKNIRHRLQGLYGDAAALQLQSVDGGGFLAQITIPVATI